MMEENGSRGEAVSPGQPGHEKYRELCALAASGNLNQAEQEELREHLADCAECREAVKEFRAVVDDVILRAAEDVVEESPFDKEFSQEDASASFRKRVVEEKERERIGAEGDEWLSPMVVRRSRNFRRHFTRYHLWIPIAVSTLLAVALGILAYRTGMNRGLETVRLEEQNDPRVRAETPATVHASPAPNDEEPVGREMALVELRRQIAQKSGELEKLKAEQTKQQAALQSASVEEQERSKQLTEERDRLLQRVSGEEEAFHEAQVQLKKLESDRSESVAHAANLEKKNYELASSLADAQRLTAEQQQLLARDRDIRELMGARDLYITEVHDMVQTGETQKAFGRVFYTRGKSLIFYAYDLKDAPGAKEASTFQAWGRRGPDRSQAFKLGVFYEDNVSKQRWVLKSTDRQTLEDIDAVFITVEPNGGSEKPTGKPLLFAYFRVPPNHP